MEKTTIAATMAVLVAILMVGSVLVPIIDIQSKETTTIINDGAGWARYDYVDDSTDYDVDMSVADSTLTLGTQSGTASEMIVWASNVGSVICSGSDFVLLYDDSGTDAYVDLGASAGVASASGTVTVTDSTDAAAATLSPAWAYVPAAAGSFGFFTDSGKIVKDFPAAAMGSFAGAYAYDNLYSHNISNLVPTYSVSDGIFTSGDWVLETDDNVISAGYVSGDVDVIQSNSVVDPSTGTLVGDLYYTFSGTDATVVGIASSLSSATSITIPDTVTSGGTTYNVVAIADGTSSSDGVFSQLTSLTSVILPESLTTIGAYAFYDCNNLALTSLPDGVTSIGTNAFQICTSLALTSLPDGITSIEYSTFRGCTALALTSLPDGLTSIGELAFSSCTALALTSLPDGLTSIGNNAFTGCTSLALTSLPDGLTSISNYAFSSCTALALTSLPDGLTSIGRNSFQSCLGLSGALVLPSTVTSVGFSAFASTSYSSVVIVGSPTFGNNSLNINALDEVLNLGSTTIAAGSYGIPADAEVRDYVANSGYIAPVSFSETVEKSGAEYDLMRILPVMVIAGIVMASAVMFGLMRRND